MIKSFALIAIAALSLAACSKTEAPINEENDLITLKFNIKNADDATTRALLGDDNGKKFLNWEDQDKIGTFSVGSFPNDQTTSNNNAGTVVVSGDNYTLNVQTFNAGTVTNIYSYFPYSAAAGKDKTAASVSIPGSQYMNAEGFDADAMPMAGTPVSVDLTTTAANTDTPCGTINFFNLGSIINFKIYSSTDTDETLTSVKYVAGTGNLGGSYTIDLTAVDGSDETTLALGGDGSESEITTTLRTSHAIGTGKTNAIDVYMVVAPGTYSGTQVVVTTSAKTYTLNASGAKTYTRSSVKPMYVDIQNGTPGDLPVEETWTKVTKASDFTAGTYYILRGDGAYYLPNAVSSSAQPACVPYNAGDAITNAMRWNATVGTNGLVFESASQPGNYLWGWSTAKGIRVTNTSPATGASKEWTFVTLSANETTYFTASAVSGRYLISYGTTDWRNYESASATNIPAEFYKLDVVDDTPSFTVESPIAATANEDTYTVNVTRNNFSGAITVTVPGDCDWVIADNVAENGSSFDVLVSENTGSARNVTLTLSASGVESQELVINQAAAAGALELPFEESFASGQGDFTIDNVALDGLNNVWSYDSSYKYMKATGHVSDADHDVESWLISPLLEIPALSTGESIKLKFSQVINAFFGTIADEASLMVKEKDGNWAKVSITYPSLSGNWSSWDNQTIDLSSYAGKKIQFAFKYVGTSSACGTWEIKNVSVKKYAPLALSSISVSGQNTIFTVGDTFAFGGTVTATYNDETTADVTTSATFSGYDMSTAGSQTITVSYSESGVTKTTTYTITVNSADTEAVVYTLDGTIAGTGNSYAGNNTATQSGISWTINGNLTTNPWRIGGKNLSGVERVVYSTTALAKNISKIEITHGTASNITVNSMTVIVSKNSDFSSPVSTLTPTFVANGVVTVNRPDGADWSNCYYKIIYNVTVTDTTKNQFLQFSKAEFTGK